MKATQYSLVCAVAMALSSQQTLHGQSWLINGNGNINPSTNFLGTTNNKALAFRTNNVERARIKPDGTFGIGSSNTTPGFALTVNASSGRSGISVTNPVNNYVLYSSKSGAGYGIFVQNTSTDNSAPTIYSGNAGTAQGVYGYSASGTGLYGYTSSSGNTGSDPFAVSGVYGYNAAYGYGVGGYCQYGTGLFGYSGNYVGVWAQGHPAWYAGYFLGDVYATGTYQGSDERAKQNITDLTEAMNIINQLHPKRYQYRRDGPYGQMNLPRGERHGLIAQEVQKVLPGLVKETPFEPGMNGTGSPHSTAVSAPDGPTNFKALNYTELIPIMVKALQEQQQEINQLKRTIEALGGN